MKTIHRQLDPSLIRIGAALLLVAALLSGSLAVAGSAQSARARADRGIARLNEDQRVLHVLNRLGFGARPGDVARVKAIGLENYINQQLNPSSISDTVADTKVKDLSTLNMTTAELYEKFPQPGQLLKRLERRGELPDGLAVARDNRVKGGNGAAQPKVGDSMEMAANPTAAKKDGGDAKPGENGEPRENEKYRQAIREYYLQNGLQRPQRISAELQASRILRAVYSERQLQEVMVDFWSNHFNVFAGKGADRWLLVSYDRDTIRPNTMGASFRICCSRQPRVRQCFSISTTSKA